MKFWNHISNLGAKETDSREHLRRIHLINRMCLLAVITTFVFVLNMYIVGNHYYLPIQLTVGALISLYYLFSMNRLYNLSLYWMFSLILLNVFYCSIEIPNVGVELFFIPLGLVPFTVIENKKTCMALVGLTLAAFFMSFLLKQSYKPHDIISDFYITTTFIATVSTTFILGPIIIFQFKSVNSEYEKIITEQKIIVETKNKEITDSIIYAERIQQAKLPKKEEIYSLLPNCFILFKPKDIVSGDFYFFNKNKPFALIAAADCTGHGVPGAFMSMIGSEKLDDAISQTSDTSQILKLLNQGIKASLRQTNSYESTRDGMDIALCYIDTEHRIVNYAGANRPLWIVRKGKAIIEEVKATKNAIGGLTDDNQHFETHQVQLQEGDTIYICSDGYADTFNGESGKKLKTKKFKEILLSIQDKAMNEQEKYLDEFIEYWKAGTEQVDDILVIGIRL
jgi:serine phosphatase RsbU (regulator of sigma subunit)